jgi:hypothetical protein
MFVPERAAPIMIRGFFKGLSCFHVAKIIGKPQRKQ